MAEDKKGILVYADWIDKFEELEDDEAGRLIKHFFRYVNDLNPVAPDRTTKLMFIDLQNQLKRDLKKWETTVSDRSINGRLGNLKRWNLDLYNKVIVEQMTIEDAESIAKHRKVSPPDENVSPPIAKVADNVNGSVNDNVTVNVIKTNNIELRKKDFSDTLNPFLEFYGRDLLNDFYAYWTEPNKSNTKFKKELERTWDLKRRLETWAKNDRNFQKNKTPSKMQQLQAAYNTPNPYDK